MCVNAINLWISPFRRRLIVQFFNRRRQSAQLTTRAVTDDERRGRIPRLHRALAHRAPRREERLPLDPRARRDHRGGTPALRHRQRRQDSRIVPGVHGGCPSAGVPRIVRTRRPNRRGRRARRPRTRLLPRRHAPRAHQRPRRIHPEIHRQTGRVHRADVPVRAQGVARARRTRRRLRVQGRGPRGQATGHDRSIRRRVTRRRIRRQSAHPHARWSR